MPTNPLAQLVLCALAVVVIWFLCGPVLRRLSPKPAPPPSLDDIITADIDHAQREAYRTQIAAQDAAAISKMWHDRVLTLKFIADERKEAK